MLRLFVQLAVSTRYYLLQGTDVWARRILNKNCLLGTSYWEILGSVKQSLSKLFENDKFLSQKAFHSKRGLLTFLMGAEEPRI